MTARVCVLYMKDGEEHQSPWFTCRVRAQLAKAILQKWHGKCVLLVD